MSDNKRETGVRTPREDHAPSKIDQRAAGNKPPNRQGGLSQSHDETHEKTRQSDQAGAMATPQSDARGAKARSRHGGNNDGTVSADPRVLSEKKSGDATSGR